MISVLVTADSRYEVDKNFVKQVAISTLAEKKVRGKVEVSITIVGDRLIRQLNKKYRQKMEATDVLSFPQEETTPTRYFGEQKKVAGFVRYPDKVLRLGDLVISYPQAVTFAASSNISIEEELEILVEHGINHLLGIHHE